MEDKDEGANLVQMWVRLDDREALAKISERNKRKMVSQFTLILEEWERMDARRFISER